MRNVSTFQGSTVISDVVQIDPGYSDTVLSINQFGDVHQRGFPYMLVHELCHALFKLSDPLLSEVNQPGFDFLGDNVRKENSIALELGWEDARVGYFGTFGNYEDFEARYTSGAEIDYAFFNDEGFAIIDATTSVQKDLDGLLVGSAAGEAIFGGNGNDYLWGLSGNDIVSGGDKNDVILGGLGTDVLEGGRGDDFIFFDAADTSINGGAGRDAAFVTTPDAVSVNLTTIRVEWLVGGSGADTIRGGDSSSSLFIAGGSGADLIRISYGAGEGARVVWGGGGADKIYFSSPGGNANQTGATPAGILVVTVAGLTAENFANLTLDLLGHGALNPSQFAAIIVNPGGSDRFYVDGVLIDAAALANDPNLQPDDGGLVFTIRETPWLGPTLNVQAIFEDRYTVIPTHNVNFFELGSPEDDEFIFVNGMRVDEGTVGVVWGIEGAPDLLMTQEQALDYIENFDTTPYWYEPEDPRPYGAFFVAGGAFNGQALSTNGGFTGTTPEDIPGIADWLAAA